MSELEAFSICCEHDGVIPDHVAAAEGVHTDFPRLARADIAMAAVGDVVFIIGAGLLVEDFQERASGAGWGIDLVLVMHFRDFDIEAILSQDASCLAGEPEKSVYAHGVVRCIDDGDGFGGLVDGSTLCVSVSGSADDESGAIFQSGFQQRQSESVQGEIDHAIHLGDGTCKILARIMGGGDLDLSFSGGGDDGLAHAA